MNIRYFAMRTTASVAVLVFILCDVGCVKLKNNVAADYFRFKNVNHICLFVCDDSDPLPKSLAASSFSVCAVNVARSAGTAAHAQRLRRCLLQRRGPVGVLVRAPCPGFQGAMYQASYDRHLDSAHHWLIEDEGTQDRIINATRPRENLLNDETSSFTNIAASGEPSMIVLNYLNISVDADIIIARRNGRFDYELFDVYNFGKLQGGNVITTKVGEWSADAGLILSDWLKVFKYERRRDFQNLQLKSIVVSSKPNLFRPEMIKTYKRFEDISVITHIGALIFETLAEKHNFSYSYSVSDRWIGSFTANSTRAAATTLHHRERDLTPLLRITPEILDRIDFVGVAVTSIETRYYYRIPDYGVGRFENQFLTPFTPGVWWYSVAIFLLCAAMLLLSSALERRPLPLQYSVFSVLALVCQQFFEDNTGDQRRSSSARKLTLLVTATGCLMLYNFYTSSVVSWLLSGPPPIISSLQGLLESSLELIFEDIGYTKSWLQEPGYYFNKKNAAIERELRERKVLTKRPTDPLLMTIDEGIRLVKAGGYALHAQVAPAHEAIARTFDARELCELGSLGSMEPCALFPGVQKRSPYKRFFFWSLSSVREAGLVSRVQRRLAAADISCDASSPRPLALGGAAPAFVLLAVGATLAGLTLVLECMMKRLGGHRAAAGI